jgi:two-component system cell cycle sensor histidine kinase/response regulator CckA
LPAVEAPPIEPSDVKVATPTPAPFSRVLLVEDNALVRRVTERVLGSLGYAVSAAEGAVEAEKLARETSFDVVVCDVSMPGTSGPELLARLRATRPRLPCLFVSGNADPSVAETAPGTRYLPKPFSKQEIAAALRELAEQRSDTPG